MPLDKLRAIQYFIAAARERSFSSAARSLDVSVPAVIRSISALEVELGFRLFDRTVSGVCCTVEGSRYLACCQRIVDDMRTAEEAITEASLRPNGTVVVGVPPYLLQRCLLPALPGFQTRYPEIQIDLRSVSRVSAPEARAAEVLVLYGWQEHPEMIVRRIARTKSVICAAPSYWQAHGVPRTPKDLEQHNCLLFRDQEGTILDLWHYERHGQSESAIVRGWLVSEDPGTLLQAALEGRGILRFSDLTVRDHLHSGRLVPVLLDWETKHSPPIHLLYRGSLRRTPRVRHFVDFVREHFAALEAGREPPLGGRVDLERPRWYEGRRRTRASASAPRGAPDDVGV